MTLYDGEKGSSYEVCGVRVEESIARRLQALGLNDGTKIKILNRKKKGALIIQVRGTRLALGQHISSGIEVKPDLPAIGTEAMDAGRRAGGNRK